MRYKHFRNHRNLEGAFGRVLWLFSYNVPSGDLLLAYIEEIDVVQEGEFFNSTTSEQPGGVNE